MMQIFYNGFALHDLGDITLDHQERVESGDRPQKIEGVLSVEINLFGDEFAQMFSGAAGGDAGKSIQALQTALATQHAVLRWHNPSTGEDYVNQPAVNAGLEGPQGWSRYHQKVTVRFTYHKNLTAAQAGNRSATFTKTGGLAYALTHVKDWEENYTTSRFSELRSHRRRTGGVVTASGFLTTDASDTIANQEADLDTQVDGLRNALDGADGTLVYGSFNQVVRVRDFRPRRNASKNRIEWSLTAEFTRFPDESNYATVDYTAAPSENRESGETELSFSGTIQAETEAAAKTKLDSMRTAVLSDYGFAATGQVSKDSRSRKVQANADGNSFIELTFNERYRQRIANLLSWNLTIQEEEDAAQGLLTQTYNGRVTASGADAASAYTAAKTKAEALGKKTESEENSQGLIFLGSRLSQERRQINQTVSGSAPFPASGGGPEEFVSLDFSFEYRKKSASRVYIEVSEEAQTGVLSPGERRVSGFIVASNRAAADAAYASQVKPAATYGARVIRDETFSENRQEQANSQASGGYLALNALRLNFSFAVWEDKPSGLIGVKYGQSHSWNYLENKKEVRIQGEIFGPKATLENVVTRAAGNFLDKFYEFLGLTNPTQEERSDDREFEPDSWTNAAAVAEKAASMMRVSFSASFREELTSADTILETRMSEQIRYSSKRWVSQPVPDGVNIVTECGTEPGERTLTGEVAATTKASAEAYALGKKALLEASADPPPDPPVGYEQPPEWDWRYEFLPRVEGVVDAALEGGAANVQVYRLAFTFREILPNYPEPSGGA